MTSSAGDKEAYVWIWLPGEVDPVVAGRLELDDQGRAQFNYDQSYLDRIKATPPAIPLYEPELPLQQGNTPQAKVCRWRAAFAMPPGESLAAHHFQLSKTMPHRFLRGNVRPSKRIGARYARKLS